MARKPVKLTDVQQARFDKCWAVYPRKGSTKGEAVIAWSQLDPDDELTETIFQSILQQNRERGSKFLTKEQKKFIKHFSSWLRSMSWMYESEKDGELYEDKLTRTCKVCSNEQVTFLELCGVCYEKEIRPQIKPSLAEIIYQERLVKITEWLAKRPESKREACLGALKKRGLTKWLPEGLK